MRRRYEDEGASAVEYGLIVFAIAAVIAAVVFAFGGAVHDMFDSSCRTIQSKSQTGDCNGS